MDEGAIKMNGKWLKITLPFAEGHRDIQQMTSSIQQAKLPDE